MTQLVETEYRGLKIWAAANLHQECMAQITALGLPTDTPVLDLGAGAGAFTQRLIDHGFAPQAVEFEAGKFQPDAPCYQWDLNQGFADKLAQHFPLIAAIEIIEHLENPRHFISHCLQLLQPGGFLVVTSPNLESWVSRLRFLRSGRFLWFEEKDYQAYGHITPLFTWEIAQICREHGAHVHHLAHTRNAMLWNSIGAGWLGILRSKTFPLTLLYPLMNGVKRGEINIYVIQRN